MVIERLTANAKFAAIPGSLQAFSDTEESEGRQLKQCGIQYTYKSKRKLVGDAASVEEEGA